MPLNYSLGSEEGSLDEGEISPSTNALTFLEERREGGEAWKACSY